MDLNTEKNRPVKFLKNNILSKINSLLNERNETIYMHEMSETENLIESIKDAKNEWICANDNFEQAVESDIVDYYAYKIKAYQVRYEYLLKKAKEKGITL